MESTNLSRETAQSQRRWKMRKVVDTIARRIVQVGGIGVIAAIALIFIFLLSVVYPLFGSASVESTVEFVVPGGGSENTLYLSVEEQAEIALRVTESGKLIFFAVASGEITHQESLPIAQDDRITSFNVVNEHDGILSVGLASGGVLFFQHQYELEFTDSQRIIHPQVSYPYGEDAFVISDEALTDYAVGANEESLSILFTTSDRRITLLTFIKESSFLDEAVTLEMSERSEVTASDHVLGLLVDPEQEWAYVLDPDGILSVFDIRSSELRLNEKVSVTQGDVKPTLLKFLTGGISLLIGDSQGYLSQWFQVRNEGDLPFHLTKIRDTNIDN